MTRPHLETGDPALADAPARPRIVDPARTSTAGRPASRQRRSIEGSRAVMQGALCLLLAVGWGAGCTEPVTSVDGGGAGHDAGGVVRARDAGAGPADAARDAAPSAPDAGATREDGGIDGTHLTAAHCPGAGALAPGTGLFAGGGGTDGRLSTSADGLTWTDTVSASHGPMDPGHTRNLIRGVGYGGGVFVAVGGYDNAYVATTCDGTSWRRDVLGTNVDGAVAPERAYFLSDVDYLDGTFVAVGSAGARFVSHDHGLRWENRGDWIEGHFRDVAVGAGRFVAVGHLWATDEGVTATSADGETWTAPLTSPGDLWQVRFGNGLFVAVGTHRCAVSSDGASWRDCGISTGAGLAYVSFAGGRFYVQRSDATWVSSADATTWDGAGSDWLPWRMVDGNGGVGVLRDGARGFGPSLDALTEVRIESLTDLTFGVVLYAP